MISNHGTNLRGLISIAGKLNLSSRALRAESAAVNKLQLPCIVHWDMNHFVILKKVKHNRVVIVDPAIGERSLRLSEFNQSFTGVVLELSPTSKFEKIKEKKTLKLSQFWRRIIGIKRSLLQILLLSLASSFVSSGEVCGRSGSLSWVLVAPACSSPSPSPSPYAIGSLILRKNILEEAKRKPASGRLKNDALFLSGITTKENS